MVHMAIASNTLAAIGGTPRIKDLNPPSPGKGLPGGAEPDLEVVLAQLSKHQLKNFMRLEMALREAQRCARWLLVHVPSLHFEPV